jgi:mRNA interferase HicA
MKRADLIRHIQSHGCVFVREGGNHTVYRNPATGSSTTVPRHRDVKKQIARKICHDLGIPRLYSN